jgi:hypothetical protein
VRETYGMQTTTQADRGLSVWPLEGRNSVYEWRCFYMTPLKLNINEIHNSRDKRSTNISTSNLRVKQHSLVPNIVFCILQVSISNLGLNNHVISFPPPPKFSLSRQTLLLTPNRIEYLGFSKSLRHLRISEHFI